MKTPRDRYWICTRERGFCTRSPETRVMSSTRMSKPFCRADSKRKMTHRQQYCRTGAAARVAVEKELDFVQNCALFLRGSAIILDLSWRYHFRTVRFGACYHVFCCTSTLSRRYYSASRNARRVIDLFVLLSRGNSGPPSSHAVPGAF